MFVVIQSKNYDFHPLKKGNFFDNTVIVFDIDNWKVKRTTSFTISDTLKFNMNLAPGGLLMHQNSSDIFFSGSSHGYDTKLQHYKSDNL